MSAPDLTSSQQLLRNRIAAHQVPVDNSDPPEVAKRKLFENEKAEAIFTTEHIVQRLAPLVEMHEERFQAFDAWRNEILAFFENVWLEIKEFFKKLAIRVAIVLIGAWVVNMLCKLDPEVASWFKWVFSVAGSS